MSSFGLLLVKPKALLTVSAIQRVCHSLLLQQLSEGWHLGAVQILELKLAILTES
jgi:hypothetical protein